MRMPFLRAGPWFLCLERIAALHVGSDAHGLLLEVYLDRLDDSGKLCRIGLRREEGATELMNWAREQSGLGSPVTLRTYDPDEEEATRREARAA